ncbi:MAG: sarcosine oxidase subunit gamma [Bosea sp. (in: a-proteobacteria)]
MSQLRYQVRIERLTMLALFEARGAAAALAGAITAAGLVWPKAHHRFSPDQTGTGVVLLGPARLLVLAPAAQEPTLVRALDRSFAAQAQADIALVSDMYAVFSVSGPGALDVLRQGAPLDISPAAFPPGSVAGTELWSVTAIILRRPDPEAAFTLLVDTSQAGYVEDWLAVASGAPSVLKPGTMASPPRSLTP